MLPDGAGAETAGEVVGLVDVLGEDSRCQAILGVVCSLQYLLQGFELHDLHDRAEDLEGQ